MVISVKNPKHFPSAAITIQIKFLFLPDHNSNLIKGFRFLVKKQVFALQSHFQQLNNLITPHKYIQNPLLLLNTEIILADIRLPFHNIIAINLVKKPVQISFIDINQTLIKQVNFPLLFLNKPVKFLKNEIFAEKLVRKSLLNNLPNRGKIYYKMFIIVLSHRIPLNILQSV